MHHLPIWWILLLVVIIVLNCFRIYHQFVKPAKIQGAVKRLGGNLNDAGVREFIQFIGSMKIPNQPKAWNACRASYELVRSGKAVSEELKEELKRTLLSAGVSGIR
ncbi:hypothetical protein N0M98_22215 [Paenibacillus doosanensis]|uniref:Uncharacterized protein n=1 Tax=Paenibacillus konkukensis TaxID=2020716 RepID=A0ABY4RK20_9BACL|nr:MULTISPECIES: hypothetical protein [Paenibacillus]MCS7462844.1 hypothetical protein [Paenibacillus doosanensis]UQZ82458.1 hypothetical protein SK3146_01615 [Paenibacillus konkukensis]